MKGFIATILNMGIVKILDLKDYWNTNVTTNLPFFRSVFSRNRFFQIYGMLHAGEIDGSTKKGKSNLSLIYYSQQLEQYTNQDNI